LVSNLCRVDITIEGEEEEKGSGASRCKRKPHLPLARRRVSRQRPKDFKWENYYNVDTGRGNITNPGRARGDNET